MPAAGRRSPGYSQLLCAVATDRRFPRAPPQVQIICYGGSQNSGKRLVKVPRLLRVMVKDPDEQLGEAVHGAGAGAGRPRVRELLSHGIGAPRPPGAPVSPHPSPRGALSLGRSGRLLTWAQSVINSLFSPSPFSGNKGALRVPSF